MQKFSSAQTMAGQAVEEIAGQSEVANSALREALEAASLLSPMPQANADEALAAASAPAAPEASTAAKSPGAPANSGAATPQTSTPPTTTAPPAEMGTKFTPESAATTAQMMAGPTAEAAVAPPEQHAQGKPPQAPPTAPNGKANNQPGTPGPGSQTMQQTPAEPTGATSQSGDAARASTTTKRASDTNLGQQTFREEPWVAKLPPSLRDAIRAQSQRPPPRAYEERLRRYFENLE
jgi:hypothetical protein